MKKKDKQNSKKNSRRIIDLTSYINPEMVKNDVNGSYTGIPADMYYNNELDALPVQDADDL